MMRCNSFAGQVRAVLQHLGADGRELTVAQIGEPLDLVFAADKRPLYQVLRDFVKSGEASKVRPGVYRYLGKKQPPNRRQAMWRALKIMQTVGVDDLMEMSGARRSYVKEFLQTLVRQDVLRKNANGKYTLTADMRDLPADEAKAARLRQMRARRKTALAALDSAAAAIDAAREAVNQMKGDTP